MTATINIIMGDRVLNVSMNISNYNGNLKLLDKSQLVIDTISNQIRNNNIFGADK